MILPITTTESMNNRQIISARFPGGSTTETGEQIEIFENISVISILRIADSIELNSQTHPARSMTIFAIKLIVVLE